MLKYQWLMFMRNDVWLKSVIWTGLKDLIVRCWDLNYGNIDWRIDVLNCLWIYIESMCWRHNSRNKMYCFKAWGISIWTLNVHRSEVYNPRETILGVSPMSSWINFHEVLRLNPMRLGLISMRKLAWACIALFLWVWCFYTMSSFARRFNMHKSLNGKELMYISIEWLHDLNFF